MDNKPDLNKLKMPELVAMAEARGISVDGLKKGQLIDLIEAAESAPVPTAIPAEDVEPPTGVEPPEDMDAESEKNAPDGALDPVAVSQVAPSEPPIEDVVPPAASLNGVSLPIRVWSMVFELISLHYDGRVSFGAPRIKKYAEVEWVVSVDQSTWTVLVVNNGNPSRARELRAQIDRLWASRGIPSTPEYATTKTRAQVREEAVRRREQNLEAAHEIDAKIEDLQLEFTEVTTTSRYEIPMSGWGDVTIQVPV